MRFMDFFSLGSKISYSDFNAIVYLLRKFKRLTSTLKLGSNRIGSDYGNYNITGGLTSVGGNFILEDDVTISSSDVLLNCFYTFYFTVVDVNLSGTVNRRVISVTGDTGDDGVLEVVLEPSLLESDEVILPDFKVDIVFDEHEYYTPVSVLDVTLEVDKSYISSGETATITATVLDGTGSPVEDLDLQFKVNDAVEKITTDETGVASLEYTGVGAGWVNVTVMGQMVKFYDGEVLTAECTGNNITLGTNGNPPWIMGDGDVVIDWGDGTTNTVNNPTTALSHTYTDGESEHNITFLGNITFIGACFGVFSGLTSVTIPNSVTQLISGCFMKCTGLTSITIPDSITSISQNCFWGCTGLTSVTIPSSVTSLGDSCFWGCTGLTSIVIPNSVTSLGDYCFYHCASLIDYQLYWQTPPKNWNNRNMPNNPNTIFTVPYETTSNYTAKNYPSNKLLERGIQLQLTADKPIIQSSETSTITATLTHEETPLTSKTLNYQVKHGSTVITSGTKTTDTNGQATIQYTGTGIGNVDVIVSYNNLQETYELKDSIAFDSAILNDAHLHNEYWIKQYSSLVADVTSNGTSILGGGGGQGYLFNKPGTSTDYYDWDNNICIEFDVYELVGNPYFQIRDASNNNGSYFLSSVGVTDGSHVKLIITDESTNNFKIEVDGVMKTPKTVNNTDLLRMGFVVSTTTGLTFKNFVVYPI